VVFGFLSLAEFSQHNEHHWRHHNVGLQMILQSHSNRNSIALAQTQTKDQWNRIENPEMN
jgi:hypothetical protein